MSIETISNFAVATGTLFLAIVAVWALFTTRRQLNFISAQFKIERSKLVPYIHISKVWFVEDFLYCQIGNVSDAKAYWLGVNARFYIVYPQYSDSASMENELSHSSVEKLVREGKQIYRKFYLAPHSEEHKLFYEGKEVKPEGIVNFATSGLTEAILPPHSSQIAVEFQPLFYVCTADGTHGKALIFSEFRDFLIQNHIEYVAVSFSLIYKDVMETPSGGEHVDAFVIVTKEHKSLQEASERHYSVDFLPLSMSEILSKIKWLSEKHYRNMSSSWNVPTARDLF
jgi:hypothetical protein